MADGIQGPYILWLDCGYEGWKPYSYPNLKEALEADKHYSSYIITKPVNYEIKEIEDDR